MNANWIDVVSLVLSLVSIIYAYQTAKETNSTAKYVLRSIEDALRNIETVRSELVGYISAAGFQKYRGLVLSSYSSATTSVLTVARVWFCGEEVERALKALFSNGVSKVVFCGPVGIDSTLPSLLWRMKFCTEVSDGTCNVSFIPSGPNLGMRFTVIDGKRVILSSNMPNLKATIIPGWDLSEDSLLGSSLTDFFDSVNKPATRDADELIVGLIRDRAGTGVSVDTLTAGIAHEIYTKYPVDAIGIGKAEFFELFKWWIERMATLERVNLTDNKFLVFKHD